MSKRSWMPLYVGDYLADTRHLTTTQHGAYCLLIMHYWTQEALPDDDAILARIVGMDLDEWFLHRPVLLKFFKKGWKHIRIEKELRDASRAYKRRSEAGRKGGKAQKLRKQCLSNAKATTTTTTTTLLTENTNPCQEGESLSSKVGSARVIPFGGAA